MKWQQKQLRCIRDNQPLACVPVFCRYTFWCLDRRSTKCECDVSRRDLPARVHVFIPFLDTLILERPECEFVAAFLFLSNSRVSQLLPPSTSFVVRLLLLLFFASFSLSSPSRSQPNTLSKRVCWCGAVCQIVHEPNRAENESIV